MHCVFSALGKVVAHAASFSCIFTVAFAVVSASSMVNLTLTGRKTPSYLLD